VLEGFEQFILQSMGFVGDTCVEIGTYNGLTALVLARYFDRVITFDVAEQPLRKEILDYIGATNVEAVIVKNNEEKAQRIAALDFCAAYSDGDHTNDTVTDFNLLKKCGCVMFHEHWDAQQSVIQLVASLGSVGYGVSTSGKFALWTD
jgi:predicted O-methyltransferase YrrM